MKEDGKKTIAEKFFSPLIYLWTKCRKFIRDKIYDVKVKIHQKLNKNGEKIKTIDRGKRAEKAFLAVLFTWPIICFFVGYFASNINSFILAFQKYDSDTQSFYFISGFENFTRVFTELKTLPDMKRMVINSFINYLWEFLVCGSVSLLSAFIIYKKVLGSNIFVVIIFLPSIISNVVWVLIYKYFIEYGLPIMIHAPGLQSLINNPNSSFLCLLMFSFWLGFGGGLLINTGAMSRIPESCIEAASLEGCNAWKEFWLITFPLIFQTWGVGVITGVVTLFAGSPSTFAFFGQDAPGETWTFGYYFFKIIVNGKTTGSVNYPYASAAGLMFTAIVAPITFLVKHFIEKGPSAEL